MSPRLTKEFRSLLLPWSTVALVGIVPACLQALLRATWNDAGEFLDFCATFIFFGGTALLAAMSFGTEFQQRTAPLLLSQPVERARLWREKLLVLVVATAS